MVVRSQSDIKPLGYLGSTLAAERTIADSGLPWTTLRATQFHHLLLMTVRYLARMRVIPDAL
jgi:uncharacterized protein YbjT (DUF2867 family)